MNCFQDQRESVILRILLPLVFLVAVSVSQAAPPSPRIFFSDLESGPNRGGENDKGAFVTLYGKNFGATRGTCGVSVGGGAVETYPVWSDEKIAFQLGPKAQSGEIVVQCSEVKSNGVPFAVRPGRIFFVAKTGSDSNAGSFEHPWASLVKAKNSMKAGDITYALDGVAQTNMDNYGAALNIEGGGEPGRPLAIVAYPGAVVTLGSDAGPPMALRVPNTGRATYAVHWVIAGLHIVGQVAAINLGGAVTPSAQDWRIVGNDMTCPNGSGPAACAGTSRAAHVKFLGNTVHDVGGPAASKLYHGVYFGTDSNHIEVGWNHIYNIQGCRGIQFHSSPVTRDGTTGGNQYDLLVHDNLIHDVRCDAINFATVDPSHGPVEAFNNVIYRVGTGPHPENGQADYACFYVAGTTNAGPVGSGEVKIYNNTCFDAGKVDSLYGGAGLISGPIAGSNINVNYQNNLFYSVDGESYISPATLAMGGGLHITGSNNVWFGNGSAPNGTKLTGSLSSDPLFVNAQAADFHLRPGSPAVRAGAKVSLATDHDGWIRPAGAAPDIGAFQFVPPAMSPPPGRSSKR